MDKYNIFANTSFAKKISNDCLEKIKTIYFNKIYNSNTCILCDEENLTRYEYVDGVGNMCNVCQYLIYSN